MEKLIKSHMEKLGISREQAIELIEEDKRIDRGEKLYELPKELQAGAKKARQADRTPTATKAKREKKVDNDKKYLMSLIAETLTANCEGFEFTNEERECLFYFHDKKYKITLACPRS